MRAPCPAGPRRIVRRGPARTGWPGAGMGRSTRVDSCHVHACVPLGRFPRRSARAPFPLKEQVERRAQQGDRVSQAPDSTWHGVTAVRCGKSFHPRMDTDGPGHRPRAMAWRAGTDVRRVKQPGISAFIRVHGRDGLADEVFVTGLEAEGQIFHARAPGLDNMGDRSGRDTAPGAVYPSRFDQARPSGFVGSGSV